MTVVDCVDGDGVFKTDGFQRRARDDVVRIVGSLPSQKCAKTTLLDDLFSSDFERSEATRRRRTSLGMLPLRSAPPRSALRVFESEVGIGVENLIVFDAVKSSPEVTRKVVTLETCLADIVVLSLFATDYGRRDAIDSDMVQAFLQDLINVFWEEGTKTQLLVLIRDHNLGSDPSNVITSRINKRLQTIWNTCTFPKDRRGVSICSLLDIQVRCIPHRSLAKMEYDRTLSELRGTIAEKLRSAAFSKAVGAESLPLYAQYVWESLGNHRQRLIPSICELIAMHESSVSMATARSSSQKLIADWRKSVVDGKSRVPDFGLHAGQLFDKTMKVFDGMTYRIEDSPHRQRCRESLKEGLSADIRDLFIQQLQTTQRLAHVNLGKEMRSVVRSKGIITHDAREAIVRRVMSTFCQEAERIEVPRLRLSAYGARVELEDALLSMSRGFSSSSAAQLIALEHRERVDREQRRTYIPGNVLDGVSLGVGLTSEVHTSGYGNAQAYMSHARGPHTINFAVCNDADAVLQEGRGEVPFLRLQPTLRFDIDARYAYERFQERARRQP